MHRVVIKLSDIIDEPITSGMLITRYIGIYHYYQLSNLISYMTSSILFSAPEQYDKIHAHKILVKALEDLPACDMFEIDN